MVYDYYYRLTKKQQSIYRKSDQIVSVILNESNQLKGSIDEMEEGLGLEDRRQVEKSAKEMMAGLVKDIGVPDITVKVLAVRPSDDWGELHGLYEPVEGRKKARITVWMRTAKNKKVVAFKSFLRTLLHEFCHHLDYEFYGLEDSYHTEGFFKRESSLFKQLMGQRLS